MMSPGRNRPDPVRTAGSSPSSCAPHLVLAHLGDKWTILVVLLLAEAPDHRLRFTEIKHGIPGISQRMLTLTLRMLERSGLILRHYYSEVPPRVEYELSTMGKSALQPLKVFTGWVAENREAMEQASRDYDSKTGTTPEAAQTDPAGR